MGCKHGDRVHRVSTHPEVIRSSTLSVCPLPSHHRILQTTSLKNLKLYMDYSNVDPYVERVPDDKPSMDHSRLVLEDVERWVESAVKFNTPDANLVYTASTRNADGVVDGTTGSNYCDIARDSILFPSFNMKVDLYIMIIPMNDKNLDFVAAATDCVLSNEDRTDRVRLGLLEINLAYIKANAKTRITEFPVFLHEIFHLLGFGSQVFEARIPGTRLLVDRKKIGTKTYSILKSPKLLEYARSYYGNSSIDGIPLEENGGDANMNNHFEKTYFPTEMMNPTSETDLTISMFSMKVLEDLGYTVDYDYAQWWEVGKDNAGFFDKYCPATPEICLNRSLPGCSMDYASKGFCFEVIEFSRGCSYYKASETNCKFDVDIADVEKQGPYEFQTFGPNSRCLPVTVVTDEDTRRMSLCVQTKCVPSGIEFRTSSNGISLCVFEGQNVQLQGFNASFTCPDPAKFCSLYTRRCPNECSGNGICTINGKCFCMNGSTKEDCCDNEECAKINQDPFRKYAQLANQEFGEFTRGPIMEWSLLTMYSTLTIALMTIIVYA